jgi:nifR3 family TIM-barrel protein
MVSEFTSVDALAHGAEAAIKQITPHASEKPYVAQVFGNEPERFAVAAKIVENLGADGIDINFGCPAPKVVQSGSGCSLYRDLPRVRAIVEATINATKLPVSIKTRTGMKVASIRRHVPEYDGGGKERITVLEFLEALKGLPVAAFTLHARSYEQGFAGLPDAALAREAIAYYREHFSGVALVNGGIKTSAHAQKLLIETNADGIAIGQGAMGNPWLFGETVALLRGGNHCAPTHGEIVATVLRHAQYVEESKGAYGITELRKHLGWYVKGWDNAAELRSKLVRVTSGDEARSLLESLV